jgi:hypothetical protein
LPLKVKTFWKGRIYLSNATIAEIEEAVSSLTPDEVKAALEFIEALKHKGEQNYEN